MSSAAEGDDGFDSSSEVGVGFGALMNFGAQDVYIFHVRL